MFRTTLKNLAARKLRLLTTSIAVLLGVAFMAGTLVLTDTIGKTFDDLFADVNAGTDAYVRGEAAFEDDELGDQRARLDASLARHHRRRRRRRRRRRPSIEAYAQIVDKDGEPMGDPDMGAPTVGGNWLADDDLNPFDLVDGRAPDGDRRGRHRPGAAPRPAGFAVGDDRHRPHPGRPAGRHRRRHRHLRRRRQPRRRQLRPVHPRRRRRPTSPSPGKVDAIKVVADGRREPTSWSSSASRTVVPDQASRCSPAPRSPPRTRATSRRGMGFFNTFLLAFALIALFVGSFIIYNSFSILVAQRGQGDGAPAGHRGQPPPGARLGPARGRRRRADRLGRRPRRRHRRRRRASRRCSTGMGIDIPAGGIVLTPDDGRHLAGRRARRERRLGASSRLAGRRRWPPVAAMRDVAVDSSGSSRTPGRHRHRRHRPRCGGHGRRPVRRRRRRRLRRPRRAAGVPRRGRPRPGPGPAAQPGARCAAAPRSRACPARSPGRTPCGTRSAPRPRPRR